jgi:DNA-binding response OmpR family regulator
MIKHVLIVDDDMLLCKSVAFNLQQLGFMTTVAMSAEEGISLLPTNVFDIVLLDIGLPGMDGMQALQTFKKYSQIPVIFVTARRRELDEIVGLELGADDYITKPFDIDVLVAHIKAVLRRSSISVESARLIRVGDLTIDAVRHTVQIAKRLVELSPKEFDLLLLLAREATHVLSVDTLLHSIWGNSWIGESQTIYVHIRWIREKIEKDPTNPRRLLTIKGAGYKLVPIQE